VKIFDGPKKTLEQRLLDHCEPEPNSGCWIWFGASTAEGRGIVKVSGTTHSAPRVAYTVWVGDPGGLHVCHRCDKGWCVNPGHLFASTSGGNHRDSAEKGRRGQITPEQIAAIRFLYQDGMPCAVIAPYFGLNPGTIRTIAQGIRRRHILKSMPRHYDKPRKIRL
jgi:hypothetical protein